MKAWKRYWCIYKGIAPIATGIGKITEEFEKTAYVMYAEGQMYPPETWEKKYLLRFKTITGAIKKFHKLTEVPLYKIKGLMAAKFYSQKKEILKIKE